MPGPLTGLRVIEVGGIGPAPFSGMMLADMGADVIRLDFGEGALDAELLLGTKYDVMSRGKRILTLNLKTPSAKSLVLNLISKADALIEGFRPGVMERLGLGPDECLKQNSKLIYGRMTGWGQKGPLSTYAGHDINFISLSGILNALGSKETPPPPPLNILGDFGGGGMMLAFGIVCGILEALKSGKGQVIDAAITDGTASLASMIMGLHAGNKWSSERFSNLLDGAAPFYSTYECADGKYISIGAIEPKFFDNLLRVLKVNSMEYGSQMDKSLWPRQRSIFAEIFKSKPQLDWCNLFEFEEACFSPVLTFREAQDHPHNVARGTFVAVEGVVQPSPSPRFSRTPCYGIPPPAQRLEDPFEILKEWSDAE